MYGETVARPKGHIHLISHRGKPVFTPWEKFDPMSTIKDPRFGVIDLSKVEILDEFEDHNLIVNQASALMVQRMAPGNLGAAGIGFLAVGTGVGTGTTAAPQAEDAGYTALRVEAFRKAITSWTYLDANGSAVGSPPNGVGVLQLTTTFTASEANFGLVEMGLLGGPGASAAAGTGYLFNYKVFPVWNKTSALNASLTIVWSLTF